MLSNSTSQFTNSGRNFLSRGNIHKQKRKKKVMGSKLADNRERKEKEQGMKMKCKENRKTKRADRKNRERERERSQHRE